MLNTVAFFDSLCKNAKHNAVLIMDTSGIILEVNQAFLSSFGYKEEDVLHKHLRMIFTEEDKKINRPEREIQAANLEGSSADDNYLVQKSGKPVWVNGESILVSDGDSTSYIVKIIHNIEAQKQLERFLLDSNNFIETILESITDRGLLIFDSGLKVINANHKLVEMFGLPQQPAPESRISNLGHPFWSSAEIKQVLRYILVKGEAINNRPMEYTTATGAIQHVELTAKFLHAHNADKKILLVVKPV